MTEREYAMLGLLFAVVGYMGKEGLIHRERLIDFLVETRDLPSSMPASHKAPLDEFLNKMISLLELNPSSGITRQ